jgi:hypothetical protein
MQEEKCNRRKSFLNNSVERSEPQRSQKSALDHPLHKAAQKVLLL